VSGCLVVRLAALGLLLSATLGSANLWICDAEPSGPAPASSPPAAVQHLG